MPGRRRKVLVVGMHYSPEPSGNAPYTTALAAGLARRGHDVEVVTGLPHYPEWAVHDGFGAWRAESREDGVGVTRLRHYVPERPTGSRRALMESTFGARAATQRGTDADVVICVSPALIGSAMVLARQRMARRRPALGLWVQDLYSRGVVEAAQVSHLMAEAARLYEGTVAHLADGVAVVHDRFATYVHLRLHVSPDQVTVIRNWTHLSEAMPADRSSTRRRLGWSDDEVIALHAGNMGAKQGLENLVDAARLAEETSRKVTFVLLGGGNQQAALKQRAEGLRNIRFLASLPGREFQDALAAADVLLVNEKPGVKEMSVPSKLTSYYTSRRPVLAATGAGTVTAHEIELSGAGIRVDPGSPAAILAGVDRLVSDAELSAELVRNAGRFLSEVLSEENALDQFELWMDKLITRKTEGKARC